VSEDCNPEPTVGAAEVLPKEQLRQCLLQHRITPELSRRHAVAFGLNE
jgi:hypothetical protein